MVLSAEQCNEYQEDGFVLLESVFSVEECSILQDEARGLTNRDRRELVRDADGEAVRSVYNLHRDSPMYRRLVGDRRLLGVAQSVLGRDLYVHQTQLNPKAAFVGEIWEWHQDFLYWQREDGMLRPDAANVVLYLDDMTMFNGPLFLVPGSHRDDYDAVTETISSGWESTLGKELKHAVSKEALRASVDRHGIAAPLAAKGSVLIFDPRLLHGSPSNISPYERTALFVRYNRIDNLVTPVASPRPTWVVNREALPIEEIEGSFLDGALTPGR